VGVCEGGVSVPWRVLAHSSGSALLNGTIPVTHHKILIVVRLKIPHTKIGTVLLARVKLPRIVTR